MTIELAKPLSPQLTAEATSTLRAQHAQATAPLQRAVDKLTACVGWPGTIIVIATAIAAWSGGNALVDGAGYEPADPAPFFWMQAVVGVSGLLIAALILTTQRRATKLSDDRQQLILEMTIANDQKVSKIIALIEEARRDNPLIGNRADVEATDMSMPLDAHSVFDAIREAQDLE